MRIPPRFIEGENAILGGMLLDNDAIPRVMPALRLEDFSQEKNRILYGAITTLFEADQPVDLVTMTAALQKRGLFEQVGGPLHLTELLDAVPSTANIMHYVERVREKSLRRQAIAAAKLIADAAYEDGTEIRSFLDDAEQQIFGLGERLTNSEWSDMRTLAASGLATIEALYDRSEAITGVPSWFSDLDELTAGFQRSDLIIIAGRPSMGKTAFALNVALNAAEAGTPTGVFSLEMSEEQLVLRMFCSKAHVNLNNLRRGFLSDQDWGRLTTAVGAISEAPLYIKDQAAMTPMEIRATCRRLKRERGLGLVVIDYLQLMQSATKSDSREREISEISRSLKALAKDLDVPVIALSQLNRKCEERTDKRPQLADLRESGAIEQDADVILFIYRDEVYNKSDDNPKKGEAEIIVGKQRNGPLGTVRLAWKSQWSTFLPLTRREDETGERGVM
jgi:replicative DNA helicase